MNVAGDYLTEKAVLLEQPSLKWTWPVTELCEILTKLRYRLTGHLFPVIALLEQICLQSLKLVTHHVTNGFFYTFPVYNTV